MTWPALGAYSWARRADAANRTFAARADIDNLMMLNDCEREIWYLVEQEVQKKGIGEVKKTKLDS